MSDFVKLIQQNRDKYNIENRPKAHPTASISVAGGDYAVKFGYDAALLKKLKDAIPESERTWHKTQKVWLISPDEIGMAINIIRLHTGYPLDLPAEKPSAPEVLEKTFSVEYLGATKDRGKTKSAYGSVNGHWASEFPEEVLKDFFEGREANQLPSGLQTFYQVLCVLEKATPEEVKKAYRRLSLQWHPDVCSEPDAQEMFIKINEAYKILNDPEQKRRYDAGLYFEREGQSQGYTPRIATRPIYGYRAPLRCGQITARGTVRLMRFVVSEILKWDDITNVEGKTMVSQWPTGADTFQILWV
jgi:DnaJ domain